MVACLLLMVRAFANATLSLKVCAYVYGCELVGVHELVSVCVHVCNSFPDVADRTEALGGVQWLTSSQGCLMEECEDADSRSGMAGFVSFPSGLFRLLCQESSERAWAGAQWPTIQGVAEKSLP